VVVLEIWWITDDRLIFRSWTWEEIATVKVQRREAVWRNLLASKRDHLGIDVDAIGLEWGSDAIGLAPNA
jgi:hypothetical protein